MSEKVTKALIAAAERLLRPLVRILLRNGIAYGQFAEIARKVYTDVAYRDFAISGKKQTISRVAVLTGLTRKEVKRLLEQVPGDGSESHQRYNRAIRVISGWLNDPQFHDERGQPADLPFAGGDASFEALVKKHSGDMPPRAMFNALAAGGSVGEDQGSVRLLRHAYVPGGDPIDKIAILGSDTAELLETIDHNLVASADQARYQRKVSSETLRASEVAAFRALAAQKSQELLEEMDAWLNQREVSDGDEEAGEQVSLGIYYYHSDDTREEQKS